MGYNKIEKSGDMTLHSGFSKWIRCSHIRRLYAVIFLRGKMSFQTLRTNENGVTETAATAFVLAVRNPHYFPNITAAALGLAEVVDSHYIGKHSKPFDMCT